MTDMICRKSMTPCRTAGMCAPHGGCPSTESVSSAWLAQLRAEYVAFGEQNKTLKVENERLRADARQMTEDVFHLVNRNAKLVGFLRELRDLEQEHPQREQIDQVLEQLISENEAAVCGELLPCPFCASTNLRIEHNRVNMRPSDYFGAWVRCDGCDAQGRDGITLEGWLSSREEAARYAVIAWNTRITPDGLAHIPAAELEALRADRDRLDSGRIITQERDVFGKTHTCELFGVDLRAAVDAANALYSQRQFAVP